jgi:hypothetical protein
MKNIHILPINLDNVFQKSNRYIINQNVYITSDVADINENDHIITQDGRLVQVSYLLSRDVQGGHKVILTTNKLLIADGIQPIDDDFLEWFVDNPSCEFVEVKKGFTGGTASWDYNFLGYKIIIPQEEPKQYPIGGYAPGYYTNKCVICKEEFMGDKLARQCEPCAIKMTQEEPDQDSVFENAKLVLREHLLENKEQVVKDLQEMKKKSNTNRDETLEEVVFKVPFNYNIKPKEVIDMCMKEQENIILTFRLSNFIDMINSLPEDTEKNRILKSVFDNRDGELLLESYKSMKSHYEK